MDQLIAAPDRTTLAGLRDPTMLEVAYATGLRVSELVRIRVGDIKFYAGSLRTTCKRRKSRIVRLASAPYIGFGRISRCGLGQRGAAPVSS